MKRLRRWLFNLAAGVSLVALVGAILLRGRGHHYMDQLVYRGKARVLSIAALDAWIGVALSPQLIRNGNVGWQYSTSASRDLKPSDLTSADALHVLGFVYDRRRFVLQGDRDRQEFLVFVPHWSLFAGSAIVPACWVLARWRERRVRVAGCCVVCGYDLRASPDRCPECGTAAKAEMTQS